MTYSHIDDTERIGDLIVQVVADDTGSGDPREGDNLSEMVFLHRRYSLGDRQEMTPGEEEALNHGGFAALKKHLERQPDGLLAITKVGMYDHSGISIYAVSDGGNGHAMFDDAGWDSGVLGFMFITRKRWDELHGGDPMEMVDDEERAIGLRGSLTVKREARYAALYAELEEYNDFITGNVWGYVITKPCDHADEHADDNSIAACPHSETIDSCWGFVGDPKYAWEEARASAGPVPA